MRAFVVRLSEREREKQREIMLGAKRGNECMKEGEEEEKKDRNWVSDLHTNVQC